MSYIKLPQLTDMTNKSRVLAEDAIRRWKYLPEIVRAYALAPDVMEAEDVWSKDVMYRGYLHRHLKEAIATAVSASNECSYCTSIHSYAHTIAGSDNEKAISCAHLDFSSFEENERAALQFVVKATKSPNSINQTDIDVLRRFFHDGEIVEIASVIQQFMGYNWFVTILGLQVEEENPFKIKF